MSELTSDSYVHTLASGLHRRFACRAGTADELRAWQGAFRQELRAMLGIPRIAERGRCDLAPHLVGRTEMPTHVREEWTIQTEPGFRLPIFALVPKGVAGRRPVVLTPHGHGKAGKATYAGLYADEEGRKEIVEGERDIAVQAVEQGYVAIAADMRAFASMRMQRELAANSVSSCRTLQLHALLFGRTLIGERVWDMGRLIDWAATRSDCDVSRVAITGNSGGGTVSLFAAACDERIAVAVPGCYYCTFEDSIGSIWHCECNYVPGILAAAEMWDVGALISPRPFMAVAGRTDDIFPIAAVQRSYEKLRAIYRVAGAQGRCRLSIGEGGHRYYKQDVWPFVAEAFAAR
jgi:dienelactone hydrolase